jgi:Ser/Thr protein kinase RdoA (MazF antagonist)
MASPPLDAVAKKVLENYPFLTGTSTPFPLGNFGGFSGARLWRVDGTAGCWCLRAWPPDYPNSEQLTTIHGLMRLAREKGLLFVPTVLSTHQGFTWVAGADRLWEVSTWMTGQADFHSHPSKARLQAACSALARLHLAWEPRSPQVGLLPATQRRLNVVRDWMNWIQTGWKPDLGISGSDPLRFQVQRAWPILQKRIPLIPQALAPWVSRQFPLQPCLCDIWHDHVLFSGEEVTGLVDFGSIKVDHVAIDLTRLLGSLIGADAEAWRRGIEMYSQIRPLASEDIALIRILDHTSTLLGAANWLIWLYRDRRAFENIEQVVRRVGVLVERLEVRERLGVP